MEADPTYFDMEIGFENMERAGVNYLSNGICKSTENVKKDESLLGKKRRKFWPFGKGAGKMQGRG